MNETSNPAKMLVGLSLNNEWHVEEMIHPKESGTGGFFSVSYKIKNKLTNQDAFLKAIDFSRVFQAQDQTKEMQRLLEEFNFEKELLRKCRDKKLKRIAVPLFDGSITVPGVVGLWTTVSYITFELAEGNVRKTKANTETLDLIWALKILHCAAVGLKQLHTNSIVHQDFKPSNVLDYGERGAKIGDLGRAMSKELKSPFDSLLAAGDTNYLAPEMIYQYKSSKDTFLLKKRAEMYQLGSLIYFLFSETSARAALVDTIKEDILLQNKITNSFVSDLPYLQKAFASSLKKLKTDVEKASPKLANDIVTLCSELCEPNPNERGWKKFPESDERRYSMERYVSKISLLVKRAEFGEI